MFLSILSIAPIKPSNESGKTTKKVTIPGAISLFGRKHKIYK